MVPGILMILLPVSGSEKEGSMSGEPQRLSPKVPVLTPSTTGHIGISSGSVPPVVTIAPTHSHVTMTTEAERTGPPVSEELVRGFQPYRAPDVQASQPTATPAGSLRPPMPLDLPPSYPAYHPSLYPHHLAHQYR